jgi:hypothetical protein
LFSLSGSKEVVSKSAEIMAPMAAALVQVRGSVQIPNRLALKVFTTHHNGPAF